MVYEFGPLNYRLKNSCKSTIHNYVTKVGIDSGIKLNKYPG